jgi:hypothetical protein
MRNKLSALVALFLLSSCAETGYDGSTRARPFSNEQPAVQQSEPAPRGQPIDTGVISGLPVLSFVESELAMDEELTARVEVQLSKASSTPVTFVVRLENGSAIHYRDYQGFKLPGKIKYSANEAETRQTIVIPPGTTRMALPEIGGITTDYCDGFFYAKLNPNNVQGAQINDDTARISVPCQVSRPRNGLPPPVRMPSPLPPMEEPCPPEPSRPEPRPMPVPVPQAPVNVRWAKEFVKKSEDSKRAVMKLEIDRSSSLPVTISVATVNGSAKAGRDFHPVNFNVTIPAGKKSVQFPVELITGDLCAQPGEREHDVRFEFAVVVTRVINGNIARPQARVSVEREFDNDGACRPPPAPRPAPPVVRPAPPAPSQPAPAPSAPAPSQPAPRQN